MFVLQLKATGQLMSRRRLGTTNLQKARIFTTKSTAHASARNQLGMRGKDEHGLVYMTFNILPVMLSFVEEMENAPPADAPGLTRAMAGRVCPFVRKA